MEPLYKRVLGDKYRLLPKAVQTLHDVKGSATYKGRCIVKRGNNWLLNIAADSLGFPRSNDDCPVEITLSVENGKELWHRKFDGKKYYSVQWQENGKLYERIRYSKFVFTISASADKLELNFEKLYVMGIKVPKFLMPKVIAYETENADGDFTFYVHSEAPLLGKIIEYQGYFKVSTKEL